MVRAVKRDLGCDVGNQLEALGKTTCIEKRKKCWKNWAERRTSAERLLIRVGWWSGSEKLDVRSFGKLGCFRTSP
jgi:hypothetical protein